MVRKFCIWYKSLAPPPLQMFFEVLTNIYIIYSLNNNCVCVFLIIQIYQFNTFIQRCIWRFIFGNAIFMICFEFNFLGIGYGTEFRCGTLIIVCNTNRTWLDIIYGPLINWDSGNRDYRNSAIIIIVSLESKLCRKIIILITFL